MTTDLAVDLQLHDSLDLTDPDREAAQVVAFLLRDGEAEITSGTYAAAWKQFQTRTQDGTLSPVGYTTKACRRRVTRAPTVGGH